MNYRLLNEGELIQEGDEWYHHHKDWQKIDPTDIGTYVLVDHWPIRRQDNTKAEALEWLQGLYDVWKGEFVATGHAPRLLALIKRLEDEIGGQG